MHWHDTLVNMFQLDSTVSIAEKMLRPVCVYFFLIIGLRLAGKREMAQLNPFDLIVLLTLSNTVQNAIIGNDNSVSGGVLGASTLLAINYIVVRFLYRHHKIEEIMEGRRDLLMKHGRILKDHCNKELITRAELMAAAHRQGLSSLAEVETAVLETTGTITFIAKSPTPDDRRHHEIMDELERMRQELAAVRGTK